MGMPQILRLKFTYLHSGQTADRCNLHQPKLFLLHAANLDSLTEYQSRTELATLGRFVGADNFHNGCSFETVLRLNVQCYDSYPKHRKSIDELIH